MEIIEGLVWRNGSSDVMRKESTQLLNERFGISDPSSPYGPFNPICTPERKQIIKQTLNTVHGLLNRRAKPKKLVFEDDTKAIKYAAKNRLLIKKIYKRKDANGVPITTVFKNLSYELSFNNTLLGSLIRAKAKQIMNQYYDYCDACGIHMYYSNTDSIQIDASKLPLMEVYINPNVAGMLKIEAN
jgi:hypothetical protein